MLVALLILMTLGFAVTLGMLLFGNKRALGPAAPATRTPQLESETKARAHAEAELERKRR